MRMEKIRLLLAEGKTRHEITKIMKIHPRTTRKYLDMIRENTILDHADKKVLDIWIAHKRRMEGIIKECYEKLESGADSDVSPDKLYRAIQSASESIMDMGIKIGIVPTQAQKLSIDVKEQKEDDKLKALLRGYQSEVNSTKETDSSEDPDSA